MSMKTDSTQALSNFLNDPYTFEALSEHWNDELHVDELDLLNCLDQLNEAVQQYNYTTVGYTVVYNVSFLPNSKVMDSYIQGENLFLDQHDNVFNVYAKELDYLYNNYKVLKLPFLENFSELVAIYHEGQSAESCLVESWITFMSQSDWEQTQKYPFARKVDKLDNLDLAKVQLPGWIGNLTRYGLDALFYTPAAMSNKQLVEYDYYTGKAVDEPNKRVSSPSSKLEEIIPTYTLYDVFTYDETGYIVKERKELSQRDVIILYEEYEDVNTLLMSSNSEFMIVFKGISYACVKTTGIQ